MMGDRMPPYGFTWIETGRIAGLAAPSSLDDLVWLRQNGIEFLITLTEQPLPKRWIDEAGLMAVHIPVPDYDPPTPEQFQSAVATIMKAVESGMGVAVHCLAGKGRTGTVLAGYFVGMGFSANEAIDKIRELRPGSIESPEQERAIENFARGLPPQAKT
jgi:atypical dual specificity phosphatase